MSDIINNSIDDFRDEYLENVLTRQLNTAFAPLKVGLTDSAFDEALGSAIATLQSGVYSTALKYVNDTLIPNLSIRAFAIYSYIISGRVANGLSRLTRNRFTSIRSGRVMRRVLSVLTDGQQERTARASVANDVVSHLELMQSRRESIANSTSLSLNSTSQDSSHSANYLALYTEKTRTGTWTRSNEDKRLYERATRTTLARGVSWANLVVRLNSYQSFARDTENNIVNQAQIDFDTFVGQGMGVVV